MIGSTILLTILLMVLTVLLIEYQSQRNVASALEDDEQITTGTETDEGNRQTEYQVENPESSTGNEAGNGDESIPEVKDEVATGSGQEEDPERDGSLSEGEEDEESILPPGSGQQNKKVYITFDDGPGEATYQILHLLDQYNIKATFFMLEPQMRANPEVTNEIVKRGHQVGLHGVTHDKKKFYRSATSSLQEMVSARDTLKEITGVHSNLVRVPYGSHPHLSKEAARKMEEAGFIIWDWNVDSQDWKYPGGSFVQNTIWQIESFDKDEPMIVLLHDRVSTFNHLEKLLLYFIDHGYEMDILQEDMIPVQFFD